MSKSVVLDEDVDEDYEPTEEGMLLIAADIPQIMMREL
jgi:hypothetical protein